MLCVRVGITSSVQCQVMPIETVVKKARIQESVYCGAATRPRFLFAAISATSWGFVRRRFGTAMRYGASAVGLEATAYGRK